VGSPTRKIFGIVFITAVILLFLMLAYDWWARDIYEKGDYNYPTGEKYEGEMKNKKRHG
jgi:hypothetical protein